MRVVAESVARIPLRRGGLRVEWFDEWTRELDRCLGLIGAPDAYGEAVHRLAAQPREGVKKRHAIVRRDGDPIALVSLRRRSTYWELATAQCLPNPSVVALPNCDGDALRALGLEIRVDAPAGWGADRGAVEAWPEPSHIVDLSSGDHTAYWKTTSHWKQVRRARNHTADLGIRFDDAADIRWAVEHWARRWNDDEHAATVAAADRIEVWLDLFERGKVQSVSLRDGDDIIGSLVSVADGDRMHALCVARDLDHPTKSAGHRLIDLAISHAHASRFGSIDLGGSVGYKKSWAPAGEIRSIAIFDPGWHRASTRLASALRRAVARVR